jgi:hypothetical protein
VRSPATGVRAALLITCPEYAPTWARDTRRRLFVNLEQLKLSVMFSVTAPGADLYPFDPRFCSHSPSKRCSGAIGCKVAPDVAEAFNRNAGRWWSELHRAAKTRADRATGFSPSAVTRAPHRTGAMAHGLADILTYQAGSRARGRRTETAQTTGVAECGKGDTRSGDALSWCCGDRRPTPARTDN